jgi:hypothetical protein
MMIDPKALMMALGGWIVFGAVLYNLVDWQAPWDGVRFFWLGLAIIIVAEIIW